MMVEESLRTIFFIGRVWPSNRDDDLLALWSLYWPALGASEPRRAISDGSCGKLECDISLTP